MSEAAVIAQEKQALESAFAYRSWSHDLDRVLDDTERAMFSEANLAGRSIYAVASEFVLDCYYERGALEPLVKSYSSQPYRNASRFDRLMQHLEDAQRSDLIERFWTSIARLTRAEFFYQRPRRDHGDHAGAEEFKNYALEAYSQGSEWLRKIGRAEAAARLDDEREALREERLPSVGPPSDLRKIDETVFWELIQAVRSGAPTTLERFEALGETLRAFKAAEIKRFASQYAKLMKTLYHWNVWALAYAARGGCSDAAFEAFRAWLILEGDPDLVALAVEDPGKAAARVPREPDLPDGPGLQVIADSYFLRKGSKLTLPSIEMDKPKGKEWIEEDFDQQFPTLVEHYAPSS